MTEEELLILNCLMYDPKLKAEFDAAASGKTGPVSVYDLVAKSIPSLPPSGDHGKGPGGGMSNTEFNALLTTIKNHPEIYDKMVIKDVSERESGGAMATVQFGGTTAVIYEGTASPGEWTDNGLGGHAGVVSTPVQQEALDYYDRMVAEYGVSMNIITSGHSKGGNLAVFVAVMRAGQVDGAYSFDGQGFDQDFIDKYKAEIDALNAKGKLWTYASSEDFVNLLFISITGNTIFHQAPGYSKGDFQYNHSPFAMLDIDPVTGEVYVRPQSGQSPLMGMADDLVTYMQRFMSADDFADLCDLATGLASGQVNPEDLLTVTSLKEAALLLLASKGNIWVLLKEPYRSLFMRMFELLGGFSDAYGIDPTAIFQLLKILFPDLSVVWDTIIAVLGSAALEGIFSLPSDVPYSPVVRDFSNQVLEMLLGIVDEVDQEHWWDVTKWDVWYRIDNLFGDIDFPADSTKLNTYYRKMIDMKGMSKEKIRKIFSNVADEDHQFSLTMGGIKEEMDRLQITLQKMSTEVW